MNSLLKTAIAKRKHLLTSENNALRILDGIGDQIKDTFLETLADKWIISTRNKHLPREIEAFLKQSGKTVYWKQLDQHQKENPSHLCGPQQTQPFIAKESGINYQISFQSGYSQGIFLDQRNNRNKIRATTKPGNTILNTFAYTGAFSVCAAIAGATTTTLDLSQPYLDWAKRNMKANKINPADHHFCKGDTFHWLKRFASQGRKFNGIILDPPTFSRDDKGKVFTVEKHYHQLIALAAACSAPDGWILASTNCRKLTPDNFNLLVKRGLARYKSITALEMPEEYTGEKYLKSLWISL